MRAPRSSVAAAAVVSLVGLAALAACGGGGSTSVAPVPSAAVSSRSSEPAGTAPVGSTPPASSPAAPVPSASPSSLAGSGPAPTEPPEQALARQIALLDRASYDLLYAEMHPVQQAFIPKEAYSACQASNGIASEDLSVYRVVEVEQVPVTISGTDTTVAGVAVTVELKVSEQVVTQTFNEVPVDGHWRFIASDGATWKASGCASA